MSVIGKGAKRKLRADVVAAEVEIEDSCGEELEIEEGIESPQTSPLRERPVAAPLVSSAALRGGVEEEEGEEERVDGGDNEGIVRVENTLPPLGNYHRNDGSRIKSQGYTNSAQNRTENVVGVYTTSVVLYFFLCYRSSVIMYLSSPSFFLDFGGYYFID